MKIGLPREIKIGEGRVALTPNDVKQMVATGHTVYVANGAGEISGFPNEEYRASGAIVDGLVDVYEKSDLIVKVKEPQTMELGHLRKNQVLFSFLHLAACPHITEALQRKNVTAVAFETVEQEGGFKPLLHPMSVVAGRLAVQVGMEYLRSEKGLLVSDAKATILGAAGTVGSAALNWLCGLGAQVNAIDVNTTRLHQVQNGHRFEILKSSPENIAKAVKESDLVVLGVVIHGASTPKLVTRQMVASMKPGSVIVDVAIDQGGCSETSRPTTLKDPIYREEGVVHYCVPNMPGSVPRSSTTALAKAVLPTLLRLAECFDKQRMLNYEIFRSENQDLYKGIQVYQRQITNQALAQSLNKPYQLIKP